VLANGAVQCWGSNSWHEVNEAPEGDYSLPVTRSGLAGPARAVVAGVEYTCALLASGAVQCWGGNQYGQLGLGSTTLSETLPVTVTGLVSGVTSLAAGAAHTCAGLESGKVVCWGILEGVFLTATQGVQTTPLEMAGVDGFTALASGGFVTAYPSCPLFNQNTVTARTCALTQAGGVQCWSMGQAAPPTAPAGLEQGVRAIGLGGQFACAVLNTGGVRCWGRNDSGQLGNGNPISPFWVQAQLQP
jgi:alpha-tubulin suppressor-like RCC1 family protein